MIGAGLLGAIASAGDGVAGPTWSTVDEWTSATDSHPWNGYTLRLRVNRAQFPDAATTHIRLTFHASPSYAASVSAVYVGLAADSGDQYDFDGTPTQVTFSSGSAGFSIGVGAEIASDAIELALDGTRDLLISAQSASGSTVGFLAANTRTNWLCWYKTGADASTQNATGYSANAKQAVGVRKIEVLG